MKRLFFFFLKYELKFLFYEFFLSLSLSRIQLFQDPNFHQQFPLLFPLFLLLLSPCYVTYSPSSSLSISTSLSIIAPSVPFFSLLFALFFLSLHHECVISNPNLNHRPRLLYPGHISMTEISTGLMSKKFLRGTLRVKR